MTDGIERDVGRVEGQLEGLERAFTDWVTEHRQWRGELRETLLSHSSRLRALENWRWYLIGGSGGVLLTLKLLRWL